MTPREKPEGRRSADRHREWAIIILTVCVFGLAGVVGYGMAVALPRLADVQDAQVCSFRIAAAREVKLSHSDDPRSVRRAHALSAETYTALARSTANGRTVRCKPIIRRGRP